MTFPKAAAAQQPDPERLLSSLAGVLSAHVVREPGGRIVEIHILASASLHPKQVVRNVESALRAGLGIDVDRRIISVAQVRSVEHEGLVRNGEPPGRATDAGEPRGMDPSAGFQGEDPTRSAPGADAPIRERRTESGRRDRPAGGDRRRLEFVRYRSHRQEDRCTCEVVLRDDRRELTGRGTGSSTAGGRAEAAARAVLDAVVQARPELRLELGEATLATTRGRTFIITSAHLLRERETLRLAGAAAVTRSPEEAAILAALQATNRWSS
jgi:hypothetical protein